MWWEKSCDETRKGILQQVLSFVPELIMNEDWNEGCRENKKQEEKNKSMNVIMKMKMKIKE
jgi:hypothetical protein